MKTVKIRDLGRTVTGHTPPTSESKYFGDYMPFVKPTDISKDSKYTYNPEQYYSEEAAEKYKTSMIPKGSTCVVCIGTIGEKMTMAHCDMFTNQSINTIVPSEDYDPDYVYYLLKYNLGKVKALNKGTASGREYVSKSTFLDMEVEVFEDISYQKKVATILSGYDENIENNSQKIKFLEECGKRFFENATPLRITDGIIANEYFRNILIEDGTCNLVDIVDVQYGFPFDAMLFNSDGKGTPIARIRNIPDGSTEDYTTEEASSQYIINNGDILIGMDGIFHINSWNSKPAYLVQRCCCIKPHNPNIKGWLYFAINEPIKYYEKTLVGATVAHLGKKHIDSIKLQIPRIETINFLSEIFELRQNLLNQNILLQEAKNRILPLLMSGLLQLH